VAEGDAGTTTVVFTVSFANLSAFGVAVDYQTNDGSASSPADYSGVSGTLAFAPGETTKTVAVDVNGDTVYELDETLAVDLSTPSGAAIGDGRGVGTILNDDALPLLDIGDVSVAEGDVGDTTASFPVTLTGATQLPVTVDLATADQTATAGSDYDALMTALTFAPGETAKIVAVTIHSDAMFELGETFTVQLSNPSGATIGVAIGHGTILNDDATPGLVITDVSVAEGDAGDALASFTLALGSPSGLAVTVDVATQDGTATQPSDYDPVVNTVTFLPGETMKTIDVTIHGDTVVEPDETFTVQLSNAVDAGIAAGIGIGTIVNDDIRAPQPDPSEPVASIDDASIVEGAAGTTTTLSFPVRLSTASASVVTIDYQTEDGTATDPSDYERHAGSLVIPAGESVASIAITVVGDDAPEYDETFVLRLSNANGARMENGDATGTIVNDDKVPTRITLRAKGRHHHIVTRGRMLHARPGMRVHVVLLKRLGNGYVKVARDTVRIHVRSRRGAPTGIFRDRFTHESFGRYVVRAVFYGDAMHLPTRAHARVRL
jgi:hypothetical protein